MRAAGCITGDLAFFLITLFILELAQRFEELAASPELMCLGSKMMAIEEQHGQQPRPTEWHDLDYQWNLTLDKIIVGKFIECGEPGMAALFASDRCEFYRRHENGHRLASQYRYNG